MTQEEINAAIDALRARGVRCFKFNGLEVEFFPAEAAAEKPKTKVDEEKCACGHFHYEHTAGLCIKGCEPTSCAPEPTK